MPRPLIFICLAVLLPVLATALALWLGGPKQPAPMTSISSPFKDVDFTTLPPLQSISARDKSPLTYREYLPVDTPKAAMVVVHGSSASSSSLHPLALTLAAAGWQVIAVDIRGHGGSGTRGRAAYVGQLEHDLEDLMASRRQTTPTVPPTVAPTVAPTVGPIVLAGFSSGGGFALRIAGGSHQDLFDGYLLLAPFLSQDAPTYRPGAGGWVSVGIGRIVALAILNGFGIHRFNDLPVNLFAIDPDSTEPLTGSYNFPLSDNFRPERDWQGTIQRAVRPLRVLVGADDEAFRADQFAGAFESAGRTGVVNLVPGVSHTSLTVNAEALAVIARSADGLLEEIRAQAVQP